MKNVANFRKSQSWRISINALLINGCLLSVCLGQLSINRAFELEFDSIPGQAYEIQGSSDLNAWEPVNSAERYFYASATKSRVFVAYDSVIKFFRAVRRPSINWLSGSWSGQIFQAKDGTGVFTGTFYFDFTSKLYSAAYDIPCIGALVFVTQNSVEATFMLVTSQCKQGTIVFRRIDPNYISYTWTSEDGAASAVSFGLLTRAN